METKLKTWQVNPPIPVRVYDWCAYPEGEEEAGNYGWGATENDAIVDWKRNYGDEQ